MLAPAPDENVGEISFPRGGRRIWLVFFPGVHAGDGVWWGAALEVGGWLDCLSGEPERAGLCSEVW